MLLASFLIVGFFSVYRRPIPRADAIVVLGAAINTPALYNRTVEGLNLYQSGKGGMMVLSGGRVSEADLSEAGYMLKVIKKNASTTPALLLDEQSHSTYENLKDTRALIPNASSVIVVSDQFHLARAVIMAKREGFGSVYWSAPKPTYYKKSELAYYYIRETFALIAYIPKFIFG